MKNGTYVGPGNQKIKIFEKDVDWCDYVKYIEVPGEVPVPLTSLHKKLLKGFTFIPEKKKAKKRK